MGIMRLISVCFACIRNYRKRLKCDFYIYVVPLMRIKNAENCIKLINFLESLQY